MDTKPSIKNFLVVVLPALLTVFIIFFLVMPKVREGREAPQVKQVSNFEECVSAGNPVMESYPRQCRADDEVFTENITVQSMMTEAEARVIAEQGCIKGGESLSPGYYNPNSKTWWFDANLNATQEGCNPACVVSEETGQTEINWRCTGLIVPEASTADELTELFAEKYPKYDDTISVNIEKETENHARGGVVFVEGMPGGVFLATKVDGQWQIVFDGNGAISCELSEYGFPSEMIEDCY